MNARSRLFLRIKLYLFFGTFFLLLILGAAAVRWLPLLRFQEVRAFDDRDQSIATTSFLAPLFRDPFVRLLGEDSVLLWLMSTANFYQLVVPEVDVAIDWWNRQLTFRPTPQTRVLIWCVAEDCVWMSNSGIALGVAPSAEGQLVRRVVSVGGALVPLRGARILSDESLRSLLHVFDFLEAGGVSIASATFDERLSDLTIVTNNDTTLLFNLRFDAASMLSSFADVTKSINVAATRSIDFRVPQKIYYIPR